MPFSYTTTITIDISNPLTIASASVQGLVGKLFSFTPQVTGGKSPFIFSATGLPSGLTIDPVTGVINGTPLNSGMFAAQITVFDSTP